MSDIAHDYEAAHRTYSEIATEDLRQIAKALRADAKMAHHVATAFFAIERLTLIVDILAERHLASMRKRRKLELALEKVAPPSVKLEKVQP